MTGPRLAVIGCGSIGRRHLKNLGSLGADLIAADPDPARRDQVSQELGIECFETAAEAFEGGADAALICTPTAMHLDPALTAAQQGLHLFIEKPIAATLEGVDELAGVVRDKDLIALVGCNMRWHPGPAAAKSDVVSGKIGRVLGARFEFGYYLPDWHPQEDYRLGYSARSELGGGVLLDAIHEIDLCRWIMGDPVEVSCFADQVSSLEIDTEDLAEMLLRFGSGALGGIHLDYLQRSYHRSIRVIGEQGTTEWDWQAGYRRYSDGAWSEWERFEWDSNDMYVAEMQHFLRCLSGEEAPEQTIDDARAALAIVVAAKESSRLGTRVRLDA